MTTPLEILLHEASRFSPRALRINDAMVEIRRRYIIMENTIMWPEDDSEERKICQSRAALRLAAASYRLALEVGPTVGVRVLPSSPPMAQPLAPPSDRTTNDEVTPQVDPDDENPP